MLSLARSFEREKKKIGRWNCPSLPPSCTHSFARWFSSRTRLSSRLLFNITPLVFHQYSPRASSPFALVYLHDHPSPALPPPWAISRSIMASSSRPHLLHKDVWSIDDDSQFDAISPSSAYIVDSPSVAAKLASPSPPTTTIITSYPVRSASDDDTSFDPTHPQSPSRSPNLQGLPDPSLYPDPYPIRPPHRGQGTSTPTLSSTDSSASTRSSAYTNSARSGDFGHVHVAAPGDDPDSASDEVLDVARLLARDPASASSFSSQSRPPIDNSRWSDLYSNSVRSRSSSGPHSKPDILPDSDIRPLRTTPSFDMNWQSVDERDEIGLTSEDETDDEPLPEDQEHEDEELPTSAMIIAEEGLGVIVRGDDTPIVQLQVHPGKLALLTSLIQFRISHCSFNYLAFSFGPELHLIATTHLLIGSSNTPNAVPSFLTNHLPQITTTLLALDISANFLVALPPALALCICLEELNIACNPLRALPVFLSGLTSLKVLIADSAGLGTLPPALGALDKLHSLSIRRNKMSSLPSWLCLLPALETLLVDGNPFQGPWKALVEPLLAKTPMTPLYPPSTPVFPLPSASIQSNATETDVEDLTDSPMPDRDNRSPPMAQEDEDTIMPIRAPNLTRSVTSPVPIQASPSPSPTLARTRTTPNKAYYDKTRAASKSVVEHNRTAGYPGLQPKMPGDAQSAEREVRKMKSAGELRRNYTTLPTTLPPSNSTASSPQRPTMSQYAASSSNLLQVVSPPLDNNMPKRFASLGPNSGMLSNNHRPRQPVDRNIWDHLSGDESESKVNSPPMPNRVPIPFSQATSPPRGVHESRYTQEPGPRPRPPKEEKSNRWGFLKKMSMGKMRSDAPSRPSTSDGRPTTSPYSWNTLSRPNTAIDSSRVSITPQIDVRISTTGLLLNSPGGHSVLPPSLSKKASSDALKLASPTLSPPIPQPAPKPFQDVLKPQVSNLLLVPPTTSPTPRSAKRRSFLPFDVSPIPIPPAANFVPGVTATNETDDASESSRATPSPVIPLESMDQIQRREEEKAREARTRALRSVMAYLRDMYDLGLTQANTMSIYGGALPDANGYRSRRPTVVETGRADAVLSTYGSRPESSAHLRSSEAIMGIRSGTTTQTNSVATTDSTGSGSGEERKYKDDKSKRARIVREIVEYVIKPSAFPCILRILICSG